MASVASAFRPSAWKLPTASLLALTRSGHPARYEGTRDGTWTTRDPRTAGARLWRSDGVRVGPEPPLAAGQTGRHGQGSPRTRLRQGTPGSCPGFSVL